MKSIRGKLWMGMMTFVGVIMVILWLFQIVFLNQFYSFMVVNNVKKSVASFITELEKSEFLKDTTNVKVIQKIDELVNEKQIYLKMFDDSNQNIYNASFGGNNQLPMIIEQEVSNYSLQALQGKKAEGNVTHPKFGYHYQIWACHLEDKSGRTGTLVIIIPLASVDETASILKKQLLIISFLLLCISTLLSYYMAKRFANPVTKIRRQVQSYKAGNYEHRIQTQGQDEIGQLALLMNEMGEVLAKNERLQKELIANVSHELRTPLTLIQGYAETIRDVTGNNTEKRERQLNIIIDETARLAKMVNDILNLSRLQSKDIVFAPEEWNLAEMIGQVKEQHQSCRSGEILVQMDQENNFVLGDREKIRQVFDNVLGNATRYSMEDSLIHVQSSELADSIRIRIIDHGEGIKEKDLEHVFERYYKGDSVDGKKGVGTGLGLAIVKSILDLHKVSYGINSVVGEGTEFWFELKKAGGRMD